MKRFFVRALLQVPGIFAALQAPGAGDMLKPPEHSAAVPKTELAEHIGRLPSDIRRIAIETEPTREEALRIGFFGLKTALKALIALPLLLLGRLAAFLLKRAFRIALGPVAGFLLEFLLWAALLFGLFSLVWKLLFPGRPLCDLFKNKRWLWLPAAALALTVIRRTVTLWKEHPLLAEILFAAAAFALLCLLFHRLYKNIPPPEPEKKWIELPLH